MNARSPPAKRQGWMLMPTTKNVTKGEYEILLSHIVLKLPSNRNELFGYPEDVLDKQTQTATGAPEISLILREDIFTFCHPSYLIK
ncbi:hypothetical protein ACTXT7_002613 [Hymenolepis weldensis]